MSRFHPFEHQSDLSLETERNDIQLDHHHHYGPAHIPNFSSPQQKIMSNNWSINPMMMMMTTMVHYSPPSIYPWWQTIYLSYCETAEIPNYEDCARSCYLIYSQIPLISRQEIEGLGEDSLINFINTILLKLQPTFTTIITSLYYVYQISQLYYSNNALVWMKACVFFHSFSIRDIFTISLVIAIKVTADFESRHRNLFKSLRGFYSKNQCLFFEAEFMYMLKYHLNPLNVNFWYAVAHLLFGYIAAYKIRPSLATEFFDKDGNIWVSETSQTTGFIVQHLLHLNICKYRLNPDDSTFQFSQMKPRQALSLDKTSALTEDSSRFTEEFFDSTLHTLSLLDMDNYGISNEGELSQFVASYRKKKETLSYSK